MFSCVNVLCNLSQSGTSLDNEGRLTLNLLMYQPITELVATSGTGYYLSVIA